MALHSASFSSNQLIQQFQSVSSISSAKPQERVVSSTAEVKAKDETPGVSPQEERLPPKTVPGVEVELSSKGNNDFESLQQKSEVLSQTQSARESLTNISQQLQQVRELTVAGDVENTQSLALEDQANVLRDEVSKITTSSPFSGKDSGGDGGLSDINSATATDVNNGINAKNVVSKDSSIEQSTGNSLGVIDNTLQGLAEQEQALSAVERAIQEDVDRLSPSVEPEVVDPLELAPSIREFLTEVKSDFETQGDVAVQAQANVSKEFVSNVLTQ
ncbi:MAG: hypothetical protein HRU20_09365 [Pseudomonadales bacterium]|nr:hypothetical protein [Pseudomonadales bacterium]